MDANAIETLTQLEASKNELVAALAAENKRHAAAVETLREDYRTVTARITILTAGLDLEKIDRALNVLYVRGSYLKAGEDRAAQLESAIGELLAGGGRLRESYIGTKDYAHWHGQAVDCTYGAGPRHGTVIFQIGLLPNARGRQLTAGEIDDAVYCLRKLEELEQSGGRVVFPTEHA